MVRALFPGTFDPIHFGHIDIAERASKLFQELVVAVYDRPLKNLLLSPEERFYLTKSSLQHIPNVKVVGYSGLTVKFAQQIEAKVLVRGLRVFSDFEHEFRMALTNHHLAPDIEMVALITSEKHTFLSSTTVREVASLGGDTSMMVPPHVREVLVKRFFELGENQSVVPLTYLLD
ncbi:MAG: pantetheine-phosphate adenylyltransferase [Chloroflexi bacterium HGW-Chloroflexi-10]|nr:MAG: pantetheine-phosphate adenylyltransferase [Chloroflexi bacterium HGW-Chloroflexi-10]